MDTENNKPRSIANVVVRAVLFIAIIAAGIAGMITFTRMKKPPDQVVVEEKTIRVEAEQVYPEDVRVVINGYGEVKAYNIVSIVSEVSGKVVDIHPGLEVGEVIPKGQVLFRINSINYEAARDDAQATIHRLENAMARLKTQSELDRKRLQTLERNMEIAESEYRRVKTLFEKSRVGTRSGVDIAEQAYLSAVDRVDQMKQAIALYPFQIRETDNNLAAARARLRVADADVRRCVIQAPFNGRLQSVALEKGSFVNPGMSVITLVDDSVLEIRVPIDSRDARKWLVFKGRAAENDVAWFSRPENVVCDIRWTEDPKGSTWKGVLHRVIDFDRQTRTLTVAVRITGEDALKNTEGLPLVDGMFCSVAIPGRILENVISLPQWAVSFENTVYVSRNQRLKTIPVTVARIQGNRAYISEGLKKGDTVVTTRLVDPLENVRLEIADTGPGQQGDTE